MSIRPRSKDQCIWRKSIGNEFCKITIYEQCEPERCPWYRDADGKAESLEQARKNFEKKFGFDGYGKIPYEADGKWTEKVMGFKKRHIKEVEQDGRAEEASTQETNGD